MMNFGGRSVFLAEVHGHRDAEWMQQRLEQIDLLLTEVQFGSELTFTMNNNDGWEPMVGDLPDEEL